LSNIIIIIIVFDWSESFSVYLLVISKIRIVRL